MADLELAPIEIHALQRSAFQHLQPLDAGQPRDGRRSATASPGLSGDLAGLKVTEPAGKPNLSFSTLIARVILDSPQRRLTVNEIYKGIAAEFPYFSSPAAGTGWKNSVRHNLSLNKHFTKAGREQGTVGKGGLWMVRDESLGVMQQLVAKSRRNNPVPPAFPRPANQRRRRDSAEFSEADAARMLFALGGRRAHSSLPFRPVGGGPPRQLSAPIRSIVYHPNPVRPADEPCEEAGRKRSGSTSSLGDSSLAKMRAAAPASPLFTFSAPPTTVGGDAAATPEAPSAAVVRLRTGRRESRDGVQRRLDTDAVDALLGLATI